MDGELVSGEAWRRAADEALELAKMQLLAMPSERTLAVFDASGSMTREDFERVMQQDPSFDAE